jgi:hypothetical protein
MTKKITESDDESDSKGYAQDDCCGETRIVTKVIVWSLTVRSTFQRDKLPSALKMSLRGKRW